MNATVDTPAERRDEPRTGRLATLARGTLARHLLIAFVAGVALLIATYVLGPFDNLQLATMAYTFVAVAGLSVLTGLNGQVSLGHGAFMAIGAYTAAKLLEEPGPSLAVVLVLSTVVTALAGILIGAAAARLRGPYLAGATLALAVGLPSIADKFDEFLGGSNGLIVAPPLPPTGLGSAFPLERWHTWVACLGALITYVLLANLVRGRQGREWRAVRDDEIAAELSGLPVARIQVGAFVVSAAAGGLAGGLFVAVTQLAAPGAFALSLSVGLLAAAVVGGLGSLGGAALGAALLVLIPRWSDSLSGSLDLSTNIEANLALAIYGLLLITVVLLAPRGAAGLVARIWALVTRTWGDTRTRPPRRTEEEEHA